MIRFLSVDDVHRLHSLTIGTHGGKDGVRDSGLLEAAVAMPRQTFEGEHLHKGLGAMAAAHLFHLCQAHAFVDGNKRVGTLGALVFLEVNGVGLLPDPDELEALTRGVAEGRTAKAEVTAWFAERVRPDAPRG